MFANILRLGTGSRESVRRPHAVAVTPGLSRSASMRRQPVCRRNCTMRRSRSSTRPVATSAQLADAFGAPYSSLHYDEPSRDGPRPDRGEISFAVGAEHFQRDYGKMAMRPRYWSISTPPTCQRPFAHRRGLYPVDPQELNYRSHGEEAASPLSWLPGCASIPTSPGCWFRWRMEVINVSVHHRLRRRRGSSSRAREHGYARAHDGDADQRLEIAASKVGDALVEATIAATLSLRFMSCSWCGCRWPARLAAVRGCGRPVPAAPIVHIPGTLGAGAFDAAVRPAHRPRELLAASSSRASSPRGSACRNAGARTSWIWRRRLISSASPRGEVLFPRRGLPSWCGVPAIAAIRLVSFSSRWRGKTVARCIDTRHGQPQTPRWRPRMQGMRPPPGTAGGRRPQLFSEHGLDGVTTRALAAEAGVNQAAIPYYFGSKEVSLCGGGSGLATVWGSASQACWRDWTKPCCVPTRANLRRTCCPKL